MYGTIFSLFRRAVAGRWEDAYYDFVSKVRADLATLNASLRPAISNSLSNTHLSNQDGSGASGGAITPPPPPGISVEEIASEDLRVGEAINTYALENALTYELLDYQEKVVLQGFCPMSMSQAPLLCSLRQEIRILMPGLGNDSGVTQLSILNPADGRANQTPDNIDGHLPESTNSGEAGSCLFSRHLEGPVVSEGSVSFHLAHIMEQLRTANEMFITDNDAHKYLFIQ